MAGLDTDDIENDDARRLRRVAEGEVGSDR
jgi:hypothetical protein